MRHDQVRASASLLLIRKRFQFAGALLIGALAAVVRARAAAAGIDVRARQPQYADRQCRRGHHRLLDAAVDRDLSRASGAAR